MIRGWICALWEILVEGCLLAAAVFTSMRQTHCPLVDTEEHAERSWSVGTESILLRRDALIVPCSIPADRYSAHTQTAAAGGFKNDSTAPIVAKSVVFDDSELGVSDTCIHQDSGISHVVEAVVAHNPMLGVLVDMNAGTRAPGKLIVVNSDSGHASARGLQYSN